MNTHEAPNSSRDQWHPYIKVFACVSSAIVFECECTATGGWPTIWFSGIIDTTQHTRSNAKLTTTPGVVVAAHEQQNKFLICFVCVCLWLLLLLHLIVIAACVVVALSARLRLPLSHRFCTGAFARANGAKCTTLQRVAECDYCDCCCTFSWCECVFECAGAGDVFICCSLAS